MLNGVSTFLEILFVCKILIGLLLFQFTHRQIDGRKLCKVEIKKDMPLEMLIEGGIGSPLAGRVVISEIYAGGAADRSGKLITTDIWI